MIIARKLPHGLWEAVNHFGSMAAAEKWLSERKDPSYRLVTDREWEMLKKQRLTVDSYAASQPTTDCQEIEALIRGMSDAAAGARLDFCIQLEAKQGAVPTSKEQFQTYLVDNLFAAAFVAHEVLTEDEFTRLARAAMQRLKDVVQRRQMEAQLKTTQQGLGPMKEGET